MVYIFCSYIRFNLLFIAILGMLFLENVILLVSIWSYGILYQFIPGPSEKKYYQRCARWRNYYPRKRYLCFCFFDTHLPIDFSWQGVSCKAFKSICKALKMHNFISKKYFVTFFPIHIKYYDIWYFLLKR